MLLESFELFDCGPKQATMSRCVSWSANGEHLAFGTNNRQCYIMRVNQDSLSDVLTISGHKAHVTQSRFHPTHASLLCTAARDHTVRLWDCRGGSQKDIGSIEIEGGKSALVVDWCRNSTDAEMSHALVLTDQSSRITVYDTRKLTSVGSPKGTNPAVLHVAEPSPKEVVEVTIFGPGKGNYLLRASQLYENDKTSTISVWDWTKTETMTADAMNTRGARFPAHVEGIYAMTLSPDGSRLATGGADAIVGLWDTKEMLCTHAVAKNRKKYIRAVEFSRDGKILCHSSEENEVELVDSSNGELVGRVNLVQPRRRGGSENVSRQPPPGAGGAESLAWHPSQPLLACARVDSTQPDDPSPPLITVAKLNLTRGQ